MNDSKTYAPDVATLRRQFIAAGGKPAAPDDVLKAAGVDRRAMRQKRQVAVKP